MKRTDIYLKESQLEKLKKEKNITGVPSSELIRRLIDKYFEEKKENEKYSGNKTNYKGIKNERS